MAADPAKQNSTLPSHGQLSDLKSLLSFHRGRRTVPFLVGFMFASLVITAFLTLNPSPSSAAPWLSNVFATTTAGAASTSPSQSSSSSGSYGSQFSSIFSYFSPTTTNNSSPPQGTYTVASPPPPFPPPASAAVTNSSSSRSGTITFSSPPIDNRTRTASNSDDHNSGSSIHSINVEKNQTTSQSLNQTPVIVPPPPSGSSAPANKTVKKASEKSVSNSTTSFSAKQSNETSSGVSAGPDKNTKTPPPPPQQQHKKDDPVESLKKCDLFDGEWVRDDSYELYYKPGSCSLIDEQFNCILNGRPDKNYQKFKWKPKGCNLPRLDGKHLLEMLKGKRLVFVGDSLNRNMWESLVCILKNSAKDPKNVFEAHGRHHFRGEASYSFIFKDYDCTVEFFVSPFLVQEWEVKDKNGTKKETLRLDLVGRSSEQYKGADVIVFNTGHWWTHDKTSKGEDYYQEGSHVYKELNVLEAFRKAVTTWARWVDANVNPMKSVVFFRGYSHSHFSGGQWNSGGACDSETVPIKNETYLRPYPDKMIVLEKVLKGMKTDVTYLNITKMTDFRKDAHPSIYRKQNLSPAERKSPLIFQDCSHWCLPGVPDAWNEVLYAKILVKLGQRRQQQQKKT